MLRASIADEDWQLICIYCIMDFLISIFLTKETKQKTWASNFQQAAAAAAAAGSMLCVCEHDETGHDRVNTHLIQSMLKHTPIYHIACDKIAANKCSRQGQVMSQPIILCSLTPDTKHASAYQCMLVHTNACWCIPLHARAYHCLLVHTIAC